MLDLLSSRGRAPGSGPLPASAGMLKVGGEPPATGPLPTAASSDSRQGSAASALPRVALDPAQKKDDLADFLAKQDATPPALVRPPQHALTSHSHAKASPAPKPYEEICRRWLAETVQAAPERHHRDPYEVIAEALPELVRRLSL